MRRLRARSVGRRWREAVLPKRIGEALASSHSESGHGLLLVLLVLVVLSASLHLVATSLASRQRQLIDGERRARVNALCDAALAKTLAHLEMDEEFPGLPEEPFAGGLIRSEVADLKPANPLLRRVTVQGDYAHRRRSAQAEVFVPPFGKPRVLSWRPLSPADAEER